MRVLEEKKWSIEHRCTGKGNNDGGCGSLLEVHKEDLRYYSGGGYFERDPAVTFRCIVCGAMTDIDNKLWPQMADKMPHIPPEWVAGQPEKNRDL